ncbi:MAG: hypothetical protein QOI15_565 [Pseudonocardiales bacterium]|nr:hypothetical protein [Pseudonocardiales bacterium]
MDLPLARQAPQALTALASFLRDRLAEVSDSVFRTEWAPSRSRRDGELLPARSDDATVVAAARQLAMVIVGAAAPFATTSYARARLLRQLHASGLLSDEHLARTERLLEIEAGADRSGAPR